MKSSGLLSVLKAKGKLKERVSYRQRRKLLALGGQEDAEGQQLLVKRDYDLEAIRRIGQKPGERRTPKELDALCRVLGGVSIFRKVGRAGLLNLAAETQMRVLQPGDVVCEQGDHGSVMWIIVQGSLEAWQDGPPAPLMLASRFAPNSDSTATDVIPVRKPGHARPRTLSRSLKRAASISSTDMEYVLRSHDIGTMVGTATPSAPGYSGELALLNARATRACTMRAGLPEDPSGLEGPELETVLLEISRQQFERTACKVVQNQKQEKLECLRKCSAFKGLADDQLSKLLYGMEKVALPPRAVLASKGEPVASLYVVASGECMCLDDVERTLQSTSGVCGATSGAEGSGKRTSCKAARNRILACASHARKRKGASKGRDDSDAGIHAQAGSDSKGKRDSNSTNPVQTAHAAHAFRPRSRSYGTACRVEIAKVGPGQLIGDIEIVGQSVVRAAGVGGHAGGGKGGHSAHSDGARVWQHFYVSVGPVTCYAIKAQDFEKRFLDSNHALSQKMADENALKISWREQKLQRLQEQQQHAKVAKNTSAAAECNKTSIGAERIRVPTPPKEPRVGAGKAKSARALSDRYGSVIDVATKSFCFTEAGMAGDTEAPTTRSRTELDQEQGADTYTSGSLELLPPSEPNSEGLPAYPSLSYATLPSPRETSCRSSVLPMPQSEFFEWSRAVLQQEHRLSHSASQHRLGTHPNTGVTLGLGGRAGWAGSRVARRCPFFIEPPEALRYAEEKDTAQQQHITAQARLVGTGSSNLSSLKLPACESRSTTGGRKGSSSYRLHQSRFSMTSSFPRSYSARTVRAAAAPRFPPAAPALPSLAPLKTPSL